MAEATFAALVEQAEAELHQMPDDIISRREFAAERSTCRALLAHARAMEDIAKAIELHAKMQSRPSM